MVIICDEKNVIIEYDTTVIYDSNNYPYLPNKNVAFVPNNINVLMATDMPQDIEIGKYCYTEADGFYPNPNWHEPSAYDLAPQDIVNAIIDEYTNELIEMGVL